MRVELDNDNSFSKQLPGSYHVNHPKLEPGQLVQQVGLRTIFHCLFKLGAVFYLHQKGAKFEREFDCKKVVVLLKFTA